MKLDELAELIGCVVKGDGSIDIARVADLRDAGPGDVSLFDQPHYRSAFKDTRASAVIMRHPSAQVSCAILISGNPRLSFAKALDILMRTPNPLAGVNVKSDVASTVVLGNNVTVGAYASIDGGTVIGDRTIVYPNVTIGANCRIGSDCVIHSNASLRHAISIGDRVVIKNGAVIGAEGFGFAPDNGALRRIPQTGTVVIEDDVEIGANSAVDRPALGETRIGLGSKLDNLVHVGHGVRIGRHVGIAAQVGIAGGTVIDDYAQLAGQVGVVGRVRIGQAAVVTAQSGVASDVPMRGRVSGFPAIENMRWLRSVALFRRLPDLWRKLDECQQRLDAIADHPPLTLPERDLALVDDQE